MPRVFAESWLLTRTNSTTTPIGLSWPRRHRRNFMIRKSRPSCRMTGGSRTLFTPRTWCYIWEPAPCHLVSRIRSLPPVRIRVHFGFRIGSHLNETLEVRHVRGFSLDGVLARSLNGFAGSYIPVLPPASYIAGVHDNCSVPEPDQHVVCIVDDGRYWPFRRQKPSGMFPPRSNVTVEPVDGPS